MKKLMKKTVVGIAMSMLIFALMFIGGCGGSDSNRGVEADDSSAAVAALIEQYASDGNYLDICSSSIDKAQVEKSLEAFMDDGGAYTMTLGGESIYKDLTGKTANLSSNQELVAVYGSKSPGIGALFGGQGYALVEKNSSSGKYVIVDFCYE
jgi:hypothetical protein